MLQENLYSGFQNHTTQSPGLPQHQRLEVDVEIEGIIYLKVPKFLDARKLCCNLPKIQEKRPNLWVFRQTDANGTANSEDPDQTAPLRAV